MEEFADLADNRLKRKESGKRDKHQNVARKLKKKNIEHESTGDTNVIGTLDTGTKVLQPDCRTCKKWIFFLFVFSLMAYQPL